MTLPDLEKHCLDDPNKPNIAEYPYYITRSQDPSIQRKSLVCHVVAYLRFRSPAVAAF